LEEIEIVIQGTPVCPVIPLSECQNQSMKIRRTPFMIATSQNESLSRLNGVFVSRGYAFLKVGECFTAHNVRNNFGGVKEFVETIQKLDNYETTIDKSSRSGISISYKKLN